VAARPAVTRSKSDLIRSREPPPASYTGPSPSTGFELAGRL